MTDSARPLLRVSFLATVSVGVLSAVLLAYMYVGFFTRYFADDYCTAGVLQSKGFVGAQRYWYITWTGRFAFTLAVSLADLVGAELTRFLPFIVLTLWLVTTVWTLSHLLSTIRVAHPWIASILLGELVIFATLDTTPNVVQSFYWQTGLLTYVVPLILLTSYVGVVVQRCAAKASPVRATPFWVTLSAGLAFLAGGFSETSLGLQIAAFFAALVVCMVVASPRSRRGLLFLIGAGLVGSLLALAVVWAAPGNERRLVEDFSSRHPQFSFSVVARSLFLSFLFLRNAVVSAPLTNALLVFVPALSAVEASGVTSEKGGAPTHEPKSGSGSWTLAFLPIIAFFLILSSAVPFIVLGDRLPPERARMIPQFVFVAATVCWSYVAGTVLRRSRLLRGDTRSPSLILASSVIIGLLVLSPIRHTHRLLALGSEFRTFAGMWDRRDREIRNVALRGEGHLTIRALSHTMNLGDITPDPRFWVNRCVAEYYGLKSIQTER